MTRTDRPLLGLGFRVLAMIMLSTMMMLIKLASFHGVSMPEVLFWRQGMAVPLMFAWLAANHTLHTLRTRRVPAHIARAAMGTLGLLCNVGAATLLPLPVATTLGFTAPLYAVLITAIFLHDRVGRWRWTAVILGFAGVLIIAQPGQAPIPPLGLAAGLGAGVVVSIVSFQIRSLTRTDDPLACVFWFSVFGSIFAAAVLPFYARAHPPMVWLLLLGIGLAGTFAQLFMARALRHGAVATVVVMDYTALIWATIYGYVIFDEWPGSSIWMGAPLIIAAGMVITYREHFLAKKISPTSSLDEGALEEAEKPRSSSFAGT